MEINEEISISNGDDSEVKLERLRNIAEMFNGKTNDDEKEKPIDQIENLPSRDKIKRTFQKFEDIVASNGRYDSASEDDDVEDSLGESNGIRRLSRKKRPPKEHIPYHEMAEVKDKFEKGLVDANKPRIEKRLDIRVQNGLTSSKKQAFEQGNFGNENENQINKIPIEADLVAGLASSKKQAFEQQQIESTSARKTSLVEHDLLAGAAKDKMAKFENGLLQDRSHPSTQPEEIATFVGTGLAHAKRSEILSKIDAEQQMQRSSSRPVDLDTEQGLATARRVQLASLANSEFKSQEKQIEVVAGLATIIKEQYMADTSRTNTVNASKPIDIETGLTKTLANAFEKPDETTVKRTVEITSDLLECGVAKERVAMFKNLESGSQASIILNSPDAKIRVDENGNVVRETDKRQEIYFEKGQTKQLVEQWKSKQLSPDRELTAEAATNRDVEGLEQGKAKNLLQMWKSIDKENSPPASRRGPRPMTPPANDERRFSSSNDDETVTMTEEKLPIESGYAKAIRERLLQSAEQSTRRSSKQITPPPLSSEEVRRKFSMPNEELHQQMENTILSEEFVPTKGQAKSLKNRFVELEQDALKVETAASKIKYVPKRFVDKPKAKPKLESTHVNGKNGNDTDQLYVSSVCP